MKPLIIGYWALWETLTPEAANPLALALSPNGVEQGSPVVFIVVPLYLWLTLFHTQDPVGNFKQELQRRLLVSLRTLEVTDVGFVSLDSFMAFLVSGRQGF